ncbi:MAG: hypothetical protein ACI8P9_004118 [Parasphingorhabdus sp.]|jgi:hypothetical protein
MIRSASVRRLQLTVVVLLSVLFFQMPALSNGQDLQNLSKEQKAKWITANEQWSTDDKAYPFSVEAQVDSDINKSSSLFSLKGVEFEDFRRHLSIPRNWCAIMLLHLNVKSCVHRDVEGRLFVDLYIGRKYMQTPDEASRLEFTFSSETNSDVFVASLNADEGPYGTSDYRFSLRAIPVETGIFVELILSNRVGYAESLADVYFSTLGRFKVGFTRLGKDFFGREKFVKGRIGAAERNVVRYMIALEVALSDPEAEFSDWAGRWHKATQQFKKQLHELGRRDYLTAKRREFANQALLQEALDNGESIDFRPEKDEKK